MARPGLVPQVIVLALGAGALGGPDALRLLLQFAGRSSPAVDLAVCVVVISLLIVPVLGTLLLARFVRKTPAGARGGATATPGTDLFAQVTATVSVGAALLVTACLLVVPGGVGAVSLPIDFAVKNPSVVTVLVVCAAFAAFALAATGSLPCAVHARFFRGAGSAGGPAPGTPATTIKIVFLVAVSLVAALVASGGFHWRRSMVTMPVGVAIAIVTVTATMLVVKCSRSVRSAAGAGGGGAAARTS